MNTYELVVQRLEACFSGQISRGWTVGGRINIMKIATIAHRRNYIAQLHLNDGTMISDHNLKAGALWTSFNGRLGISEYSHMSFDLSYLIHPVDLPDLISLLSKEEIDMVVKDMPSDHAPGPDGFNGCFREKMLALFLMIFTGFVKVSLMEQFTCNVLTIIRLP